MTLFNPGAGLVAIGMAGFTIGFVSPAQANDSATASSIAQTNSVVPTYPAVKAEASRIEKLRHLQATAIQRPANQTPPQAGAANTTSAHADGVYLYGQQALANQPATAYFVFESQAEAVTGAFYMPNSSFDCVQGQMSNRQMSLEVTDSYTQETHAYALGLNPSTQTIASRSNVGPLANATPPNLEGYYPLPVSDHDREILATCQAQF